MITADILIEARALYASAPSHAPSRAFPAPDEFCVITALSAAAPRGDYFYAAANALRAAVGHDGLVSWNAENTTETVLAGFDGAIAALDVS